MFIRVYLNASLFISSVLIVISNDISGKWIVGTKVQVLPTFLQYFPTCFQNIRVLNPFVLVLLFHIQVSDIIWFVMIYQWDLIVTTFTFQLNRVISYEPIFDICQMTPNILGPCSENWTKWKYFLIQILTHFKAIIS